MELTPKRVEREHEWVRNRAPLVVPILNETRDRLGILFETDVDSITEATYKQEVDQVFANGEVAVNVAGYVGCYASWMSKVTILDSSSTRFWAANSLLLSQAASRSHCLPRRRSILRMYTPTATTPKTQA